MYYILGLILLIAAVVFTVNRFRGKEVTESAAEPDEKPRQVASDCCGAHEICEFDESVFNEDEIIYFNDEELDELRNIREDQLTAANMDDLRDVLYTLRTDEINKWLTSISRRHIHLPAILQQEARQLIAEQ